MPRGEGGRSTGNGCLRYASDAAPILVTAHAEGAPRLLTFGLPRFLLRRRFWSWNYGDSYRRAYDHLRDIGSAPIRWRERRPQRFRIQPPLAPSQGCRGGKRRCLRALRLYHFCHRSALLLSYIGALDYRALVARLPGWISLIVSTAGGRGGGSGELSRPRLQCFLPRSNGPGGRALQCLALAMLSSGNEGGPHLRTIRPCQRRTMPAIVLPRRSGGHGKICGTVRKARCDIP